MEDFIVFLVVALIFGGALVYIIKAKKSGVRCIGCPDSKTCSGKCRGCNGACGEKAENK